MNTQMMIKCKNNKTEISRLWLPEILSMLQVVYEINYQIPSHCHE